MTRFPALIALLGLMVLPETFGLRAEPGRDSLPPGTLVDWRDLSLYAANPVAISDRDESANATSALSIDFPRLQLPNGRQEAVLEARFVVQPNQELGYSYAGVAIPFHSPTSLMETESFQFLLQSTVDLEAFEVVVRDTERQRAVHLLPVSSSADWQHVSLPASTFREIRRDSIESIAFVVGEESEGVFRVAELRLPIQLDAPNMTVLSQLQRRTKWHLDLAMATRMAEIRQLPLALLIVSDSRRGTEWRRPQALEREEWIEVLDQTVAVVADSNERLPDSISSQVDNSAEATLFLLSDSGEILASTIRFDPQAASDFQGALSMERGRD